MKKCVFIANCQQGPLKFLLRSLDEFNRLYSIVDIVPVHQWSGEESNSFESIYNDVDVIFTQPVFEEKYGLASTSQLIRFNKSTRNIPVIIFPGIDFIGYSPFSTRIPIRTDRAFAPDAQCGIVLWCFLNGYDRAKATKFYHDFCRDNVHSEFYKTVYGLALKRLENAERMFYMDTHVSYLFRNVYVREKLMLNRWHPSNVVYTYLANRLLAGLGICEKVPVPKREFMLHDEMPVSSAVKEALGIEFDDGGCFYYMGFLLSQSEYVSSLYTFYKENSPTVEAAAKMNEEKLKVIDRIISGNYSGLDLSPLFHW